MKAILSFVSSKKVMVTLLLFISALSFSQTVTNVFPTRVTNGSMVTIIGTGFDSNTDISISDINIGSITITGNTQMSFEITRGFGSSGSTFSRDLKVDGIDTGYDIQFVHAKNISLSSRKITEIYTNFNAAEAVDEHGDLIVHGGFWRSTSNIIPNDKHELLGFKMPDGTIFSTGVDDVALEAGLGLGPNSFISQEYKAYSTNGVSGKTHGSFFMEMADLIDGYEGGQESSSPGNSVANLSTINGKKIIDVLIDGTNGLELGTGITNFNTNASVKFFSGNGQPGGLDGVNADLLITQIADPGSRDYYYYEDEIGNIVGTPLGVQMSGTSELSKWKVDFFSYPNNQDFADVVPTNRWSSTNAERGIRMAALQLEDFDINNTVGDTGYIGDINNINMAAGGTADIAFLAYNTNSFDIKTPLADAILPQYICDVSVTGNTATFTVNAYIENEAGDGTVVDPAMTYEWRKNNITVVPKEIGTDTYEITNVTAADLGTYYVKLDNGEQGGSIILPVTLSQGGAPTTWNGSAWTSSYTVADKERSLIFGTDFNQDEANLDQTFDLLGCDCVVAADVDVKIIKGQKMVLYNEITVAPEVFEETITDEFGDEIIIVYPAPAGTFTLEDDASLVQINDVENSGKIKVKRALSGSEINPYDYVYWASPVTAFNISGISNTPTYQWDVNASNNDTGVGNWVSATGATMTPGEGYIVRVANSQLSGFTTEFYGEPNNGPLSINVEKSSEYDTMDYNDSSWNLIGNPYPSAIDAETFLTANTILEGRVDIWTHDTGLFDVTGADDAFYDDFGVNYGDQYITFNSTGTSTPDPSNTFNGKIASGQAFFVRVDNDAPDSGNSVDFTNAMRHDNIVAYDNNQFFRGISEETVTLEKQLVWLSLSNENDHAISTLIGYVDGATEGKDRLYDAYTNNEGFNLYSLISEDEKLVIQGLPLPFVETNTVPLGFELEQEGIYTIAIAHLEGSLFEEQEQAIYLEDTYTNEIHDLRAAPYTFTGEAGEFNDRFILRYTASALSVTEVSASDAFAYINNSMLHVKSSQTIKSIEIYDMSGKQITNYVVGDNGSYFSSPFTFSNGVYIASIKLDNGAVVTRKVIH